MYGKQRVKIKDFVILGVAVITFYIGCLGLFFANSMRTLKNK
jgi:hypothetical protein